MAGGGVVPGERTCEVGARVVQQPGPNVLGRLFGFSGVPREPKHTNGPNSSGIASYSSSAFLRVLRRTGPRERIARRSNARSYALSLSVSVALPGPVSLSGDDM